MTDLQAALGIQQLKKVSRFAKRRREIWYRYKKELANLPIILPPEPASNTTHALHLFIIMIDTQKTKITRDELISRLHRKNIGTGVHYIALHLQPYYREIYSYQRGDFPNADFISERTLSIPFSAKLTDEDVGDVINAVRESLS
jgi:dTDP-4-amino-4,6-dideoxygalactose transaminase